MFVKWFYQIIKDCKIIKFLVTGRKYWTPGSGVSNLEAKLCKLNSGCRTLDAGLWILDTRRWTIKSRRSTLDAAFFTVQ